MKKTHVLRRPMRVADVDDFDDDLYEQQANRAERSRIRRWREIKRQEA